MGDRMLVFIDIFRIKLSHQSRDSVLMIAIGGSIHLSSMLNFLYTQHFLKMNHASEYENCSVLHYNTEWSVHGADRCLTNWYTTYMPTPSAAIPAETANTSLNIDGLKSKLRIGIIEKKKKDIFKIKKHQLE